MRSLSTAVSSAGWGCANGNCCAAHNVSSVFGLAIEVQYAAVIQVLTIKLRNKVKGGYKVQAGLCYKLTHDWAR
jgi:hypothetical protein